VVGLGWRYRSADPYLLGGAEDRLRHGDRPDHHHRRGGRRRPVDARGEPPEQMAHVGCRLSRNHLEAWTSNTMTLNIDSVTLTYERAKNGPFTAIKDINLNIED